MDSYCVKCGKKGPIISVKVGTQDDPVQVKMGLCWDCFDENFSKDVDESVYYLYDYEEEDRDLDSDDEFDNTFEGS